PCSLHPLSLHDALPIYRNQPAPALGPDLPLRHIARCKSTSAVPLIATSILVSVGCYPSPRFANRKLGHTASVRCDFCRNKAGIGDRKSTRLNSSHVKIA